MGSDSDDDEHPVWASPANGDAPQVPAWTPAPSPGDLHPEWADGDGTEPLPEREDPALIVLPGSPPRREPAAPPAGPPEDDPVDLPGRGELPDWAAPTSAPPPAGPPEDDPVDLPGRGELPDWAAPTSAPPPAGPPEDDPVDLPGRGELPDWAAPTSAPPPAGPPEDDPVDLPGRGELPDWAAPPSDPPPAGPPEDDPVDLPGRGELPDWAAPPSDPPPAGDSQAWVPAPASLPPPDVDSEGWASDPDPSAGDGPEQDEPAPGWLDALPDDGPDVDTNAGRRRGRRSKRKTRNAADGENDISTFAPAPDQKPSRRRGRRPQETTPRRDPRALESIRKASVTVVDGPLVTYVTIRRGVVTSVVRDDVYDDIESAAAAAARRGGVVVWACSDVKSVPRAAPEGNARSRRLEDASNAEAAFGPDVQAARYGRLLLGAGGPGIAAVAKRCSLRFAAGAVERSDGHWVRVGVSGVDVTMVKDGEVYEWAHMSGIGTGAVRAALDEGGDKVAVRAAHVERLAVAVSGQRREWMRSGSTEALMYLHGPGAGWAGVDTVLLEVSACRVLSPRVIEAAEDVPRSDLGQAAVAALGYLAPEVFSTRRVLRGELRKVTIKKWVPSVVACIVAALMFAWSWQQGQSVADRVAAAETRTENAWTLEDLDGKALAQRAVGVSGLVATLKTVDGYAWGNVIAFRLAQAAERGAGQHLGVDVARCETVEMSETVEGGFSGVDAALPRMQTRSRGDVRAWRHRRSGIVSGVVPVRN